MDLVAKIMQTSDTTIQGAREHNLQSVDLVLPRNQLICLTGVSGSGKSHSTLCLQRANGDIWKVSQASRAISSGKCLNLMWTLLLG